MPCSLRPLASGYESLRLRVRNYHARIGGWRNHPLFAVTSVRISGKLKWPVMGWGLRRSLKLGPLKLNFSKSGVGYSVGVRGFRVGKDAKGRSYTAASIPGTGLYNRTYSGKGNAAGTDAVPGSSAPPQQRAGNGPALVVAFIAGGLLVLFLTALFSSRPVTPPVTPPAAVSAPAARPQPVPVNRRRVHRAKQSTVQVVRHPSATPGADAPQTLPNAAPNAQPPAN
jgi:hypothetical protein